MARSTRRAVQLVMLTLVLAAAGAGVYLFHSGGARGIWTFFAPSPSAELVADDDSSAAGRTVLSQSDLDAVASAWAGASPVKRAEYAQYVEPVEARSASAAVDDRYGLAGATPTVLRADDGRAVTRGQEPDDESEAAYEDFEIDDTEDEDASRDVDTGEDDPRFTPSSQRARDAFHDGSSAEDDRYGNSAGEPESEDAADALPPTVNPFASQPAPLPATPVDTDRLPTAPTAAAEAAQRLPAADGRVASLPVARSAEPPRDQFRAGSGTPISLPNDAYASSQRTLGSDSLPESIDGGLPSGGDDFAAGESGTGRPGERALEGPQKPALVIQKFAPPEIQVGKPAKFTIQVRNVGGQTADSVVIRDEVPHGTRLVNTVPRAEHEGSQLVWRLGKLSTGEERTIEIELMPLAEGEIGSVANVTYVAQASVKTRCTMPQLAIRMTAPATVMIGQEQRVKIELRNPGTGDATGVMLFENVPENVRHAAGPALEFEIGTLRPGETRELELALHAEKAGQVVNMLTARADGNLQVQQQVEFEVIAPALQVSVEGPERRYLERPATYQVSIENPGTAPAHDIELMTKLPRGMRFVRANNMGEYDASTHAIYWSLAELPEGERGTVELVAMPVESGQQTLEITGKASQGLVDETRQNVLVEGLAAIMFEVKDSEDPIEVGGETSYEIRVVNQGTKAATNVQVVVNLPPAMEMVSATGDTRYSAQAGGVVFEPLAQLAPKASSVYRVQVKGREPGDQRVMVQVNTDDISQPIRREESTRVFGDE